MLLSLSKKFLFIANLKSASTSIEHVLGPYAELRLQQSNYGKHQSFADFSERFRWLLGVANVNELFIFGVIRDPVDYALSMFNSHRRDQFKNNPKLYTGNMDYSQFIAEWVPKNADQIKPQFTRFTSAEGRLVTNLLISFDKLPAGLALVAKRLNVPELADLPKTNESPSGLTRKDLTPEHIAWIENRLQKDREILTRYCDKIAEF
jgi:hypothetical protein